MEAVRRGRLPHEDPHKAKPRRTRRRHYERRRRRRDAHVAKQRISAHYNFCKFCDELPDVVLRTFPMPQSRPPSDRLADLQTRKKQLEAQIAALGAREAVQRRKDDDRRIALLGKILLEDLPNDDALRDYARRRLPATTVLQLVRRVLRRGPAHRRFEDQDQRRPRRRGPG